MKKAFISIAIVTLLATIVSCGNKTAKGSDSDSATVVDSTVVTASAELWTTEAVEAQVRKIYDRLNDMDKNGIINIHQPLPSRTKALKRW